MYTSEMRFAHVGCTLNLTVTVQLMPNFLFFQKSANNQHYGYHNKGYISDPGGGGGFERSCSAIALSAIISLLQ